MAAARRGRSENCSTLRALAFDELQRGAGICGAGGRFESDQIGNVEHTDGATVGVHDRQLADLPGLQQFECGRHACLGRNDERRAGHHARDRCVERRVLPVLVAGPGRKPGQAQGRTPYLQGVHFEARPEIGAETPVRIVGATMGSLTGVRA